MRSNPVIQRKSTELKKHVGLIHSTNKLTLLERKIANALLFNAYDELPSKSEHVIHLTALCSMINYNSKDSRIIKQALISLLSTVLEWNLLDKSNTERSPIWMASAMLSDVKIEGALCTYSYSNRMKELCYHPELYGRLNMQALSMFKSSYGLALYENCIRYQNIANTPWFDLPTYRKLMGVEEGQYLIFRDLNRRVLQPAIKEVNQYSPIFIETELKKNGHVVSFIRFLIHKQVKAIESKKEIEPLSPMLARLKTSYGFSDKQATSAITTYGESYIQEKMTIIESSRTYLNGKIEHLGSYLEKALKENYQSQKSSRVVLDTKQALREEDHYWKTRQSKYAYEYRAYVNQEILKAYVALTDKDKKSIDKKFAAEINTTLYGDLYVKYGIENQLVKDRFIEFVRLCYPDSVKTVLSFKDFYNQSILQLQEELA